MNYFNLALIKFIQENSPVHIETVTEKFQKTLSTIKRAIKEINYYLDEHLQIHIIDAKITTRMGYQNYIDFTNSIHLNRYLSTTTERVKLLTLESILFESVNIELFKQEINISYSTIKNDINILRKTLPDKFEIHVKDNKNLILSGDEITIRMFFCKHIFHALELDFNNTIIPHKANFPLDKHFIMRFLDIINDEIQSAKALFQQIEKTLMLSYNSKKYLIIYLCIALYRIKQQQTIRHHINIPLPIFNSQLDGFSEKLEQDFLNTLLSSLNYQDDKQPCIDHTLYGFITDFIDEITKTIHLYNGDKDRLLLEIYQVIYAAILQSKLNIDFDDKKLEKVADIHSELFFNVKLLIEKISYYYQQSLSKNMIATIVLILKKAEIRSLSINQIKKRIYIVSNASERKIGYFKTLISSIFDIDIINCININELHVLNKNQFDFIVTFTNKISNYLREEGIECIKVNFELQPRDIAHLLEAGFPSIKRKINSDIFVNEIMQIDKNRLADYLRKNYIHFFI
ncbi:Transcriptional antiterminator [Pasteurella testudinis DSM 23072]|uniref:Transcriptional antiterminator n=1 Tax=Pasteurella testudinis DSM 23072 TaxID=1122938 RepID=A0A1W1UDC8_9PAST|nr:helix-turn-helix domain-containing protein [Pasteurella testudinis]SMB79060.1 Transcriptional antiterminator [Pasteurella testudinis DSM 23072]SUB52419.1 Mga helix-turn-helix domain [Pasteurella testudinis]